MAVSSCACRTQQHLRCPLRQLLAMLRRCCRHTVRRHKQQLPLLQQGRQHTKAQTQWLTLCRAIQMRVERSPIKEEPPSISTNCRQWRKQYEYTKQENKTGRTLAAPNV